jgi:DNA modification methylase
MMIINGDCEEELKKFPDDHFDSCVTDPPYGLSKEPDIHEVLTKWLSGEPYDHGHGGFMGKKWDSFVPHPNIWREVFRVLKPGSYALVFAGTRTQDLMTIALRIAGFEVRDVIEWLYFSGFPKSMNVGKAFDRRNGVEREVIANGPTVKRMVPGADQEKGGSWVKNNGRTFTHTITTPTSDLAKQWDGWGTALKPAHEPIIVVRKPLIGTVPDNIEKYGTGGLNIDSCRISRGEGDRMEYGVDGDERNTTGDSGIYGKYASVAYNPHEAGRFPANIVTVEQDGFFSSYCNVTPSHLCHKASEQDRNSDVSGNRIEIQSKPARTYGVYKGTSEHPTNTETVNSNNHPTVKPTDLMAWLICLVTPPDGKVLDPFCGSGTTLVAAKREKRNGIGIELEEASVEISRARVEVEVVHQLKLF